LISIFVEQFLNILVNFGLALITHLDILFEVTNLALHVAHLVTHFLHIFLNFRHERIFFAPLLLPMLPFLFHHLLVNSYTILIQSRGRFWTTTSLLILCSRCLFFNKVFNLIVSKSSQIGVL